MAASRMSAAHARAWGSPLPSPNLRWALRQIEKIGMSCCWQLCTSAWRSRRDQAGDAHAATELIDLGDRVEVLGRPREVAACLGVTASVEDEVADAMFAATLDGVPGPAVRQLHLNVEPALRGDLDNGRERL